MRGDTLATAFIENATGFAQAAELDRPGAVETRLHAASIALELSLKAVILHQGGSDEQNRREIGHDLTRAWHLARAFGFEPADELAAIVARLSPFYRRHGLSELARDVGAAEAAQIASTVQRHVEAVRRWMETD